jgi:hypothetical protein
MLTDEVSIVFLWTVVDEIQRILKWFDDYRIDSGQYAKLRSELFN